MSDIRDYPKDTVARIDTDTRDIDVCGYVMPDAWVRLALPDGTGLYFQQNEIELVASATRARTKKKKVRTPA
jgi:hypothetical protein